MAALRAMQQIDHAQDRLGSERIQCLPSRKDLCLPADEILIDMLDVGVVVVDVATSRIHGRILNLDLPLQQLQTQASLLSLKYSCQSSIQQRPDTTINSRFTCASTKQKHTCWVSWMRSGDCNTWHEISEGPK